MDQVDVRITISNSDLSISFSDECESLAIGILTTVIEDLFHRPRAGMSIFKEPAHDGSLLRQPSDHMRTIQDLPTGETKYRIAISAVIWEK